MEFGLFDADNHYYEAEDAFTRFGDEDVRSFVRWVVHGKRRHLLFGTHLQTAVPNPTFNPIARPGIFYETLVALQGGERPGMDKSRFGQLESLPAIYRERDARLLTMDDQGVERILLFPTLANCVEEHMADDPVMLYAAFHAFNRWLDEDWGFNYENRIYAPPAIVMQDVDRSVSELEWVLDRGAKVIALRPGPCHGRSPADPYWDPFWARVNEAVVLCGYHAIGGPSAYHDSFRQTWDRMPVSDRGYAAALEATLYTSRLISDTVIAMILGNFFVRFPNIKIASIEMGSMWVDYTLHLLDHAGGLIDRRVNAFGTKLEGLPSEVLKRHVYVSPHPEEDIVALSELIGVSQVIMGSDWPHAEGLPQPAEYATRLKGLDDASVKRIMRENALELVA